MPCNGRRRPCPSYWTSSAKAAPTTPNLVRTGPVADPAGFASRSLARQSLALLGLPAYAWPLLDCLEHIAVGTGSAIRPVTLDPWRRAVGANQTYASG